MSRALQLAEQHKGRADDCGELARAVLEAVAPPVPEPKWPPCRGVPRAGCNYLAACDSICNKCGQVHRFPDATHTQPASEPVAWHVNHHGSCQIFTSLDGLDLTECTVAPLYATPQPAAAPVLHVPVLHVPLHGVELRAECRSRFLESFTVIVDPDVPDGEAHLVHGGRVIAKLVLS